MAKSVLLDRIDSVVTSDVLSDDAILDDFGEPEDLPAYKYAEVLDTTTDRFQIIFSWFNKAIDDLTYLVNLPDNWDSYGSPKIPNELIDIAGIFLNNLEYEISTPPFVVPISGGGIQFEWHKDGRELEIEFIDTNHISYLKVVNNKPLEEGNFNIKNSHVTRSLIHWLNSG